jgi:hypothetical protein
VQTKVPSNAASVVPGRRAAAASAVASGLVVDAMVFPEAEPSAVRRALASVDGQRVVAVCSTRQRIGMYVLGAALCAQMRLCELGAAHAEVVILCGKLDDALMPLLRDHPGIRVLPASA